MKLDAETWYVVIVTVTLLAFGAVALLCALR
jgi:hypothetical protein